MTPRRTSLSLAAAAAALAVERWARRTRATRSEKRRTLAGDDGVPAPMWEATRAITIGAPPQEVWPWLVQMGFPTQRAGWYTPYWLDRALFGIRARSADCVLPQFQQLAVGDRVSDSERGHAYFTAAIVEPPGVLVLHSRTHPLPLYDDTNFTWAFIAEEHDRGTRLIMRARIAYTPLWPAAIVKPLIAIGVRHRRCDSSRQHAHRNPRPRRTRHALFGVRS